MAAADYRLMTEATGQRIAAALEALSGTGAAAAAARANLDVYSTGETDELIAQSTANIGTVYNQNNTSVSVTFTGGTKEVCALTLPPGIYVVTGTVRFDGSVANGRQGATITYNNADNAYDVAAYTLQTKPASTENQYYNVTRIAQITATNNTVYLMAYDAALSGTRILAANLWAVRIK